MNEDENVEKLKKELQELIEESFKSKSPRKSRRSTWVEAAAESGSSLVRDSIDIYPMLKALSQSLNEINDRLTSIEDSLGLARCADENCKLIALNGDYLCKHHREEVNHQSDVAQPS